MVRVRWPSEEETTAIPAPGTLPVLASSGDQAPPAERPEQAAQKQAATEATATAKKAATTKSTTSKKGRQREGRQQEDHGRQAVVALIRGCQVGGPGRWLRR